MSNVSDAGIGKDPQTNEKEKRKKVKGEGKATMGGWLCAVGSKT